MVSHSAYVINCIQHYFQDGNPFTCGGVDVDVLIRNHAPPKEYSSGRLASLKKSKSSAALTPFLEAYR